MQIVSDNESFFNYFLPTSSHFCRLLLTFAVWTKISSVCPDMDPVSHSVVSLKDFLKKLILRKVNRRQQKHGKLPRIQRLTALVAYCSISENSIRYLIFDSLAQLVKARHEWVETWVMFGWFVIEHLSKQLW